MKEIWKEIDGYGGKYFISSWGRVKGPKGIITGLKRTTIYGRIKMGWPVERIINQPYRCPENGHIHYGQLNGEINSWGEKYCS